MGHVGRRHGPRLLSDPAYYAGAPDWSADGRAIVYHGDAAGSIDLWLVPAAGGTAIQLTNDAVVRDYLAFSPDGALASSRLDAASLYTVPATGGPPEQLPSEESSDGDRRGRRPAAASRGGSMAQRASKAGPPGAPAATPCSTARAPAATTSGVSTSGVYWPASSSHGIDILNAHSGGVR